MGPQEIRLNPNFAKFDQAKELEAFQERHRALLAACRAHGKEVRALHTHEYIRGQPPEMFTRSALNEFIFPKWKVTLKDSQAQILSAKPGYFLRFQDMAYEFDASRVTGHLRVEYDGEDGDPTMYITDILGESQLPDGVLDAIQTAFTEPTAT